jgi:hypothetical protein
MMIELVQKVVGAIRENADKVLGEVDGVYSFLFLKNLVRYFQE